ncbi:MAG: hypothetical protein UX91_C0015G0011 [Candidatus Amesbacteria bacterium GW2011_GWB1_47_19]|nr:MAG: hypothetical protein UX91_C0015G0011 [Candidatus Amesbacteria bacterium GW2011_GWB1_47_19]
MKFTVCLLQKPARCDGQVITSNNFLRQEKHFPVAVIKNQAVICRDNSINDDRASYACPYAECWQGERVISGVNEEKEGC